MMYLFHIVFCLFFFAMFTEATKLTCNEVTDSNYYEDCTVTFTICKYAMYEKCESIDSSVGTNIKSLERILSSIKFNPRERTAIITHGFGKEHENWMENMAVGFTFVEPDVNIILVKWPNDHSNNFEYRKAALLTESVAKKTAALLEKLDRIYPKQRLQLHFVGHSLGAHLVGQAARILKQREIIVDRITALDPALPCFKDDSASLRLRKTDAEFVDVIHSNSGPEEMNLGIYEMMGHVDFYPNGGNKFNECQQTSLIMNHLYNCNGERLHTLTYHSAKNIKIQAMINKLELFPDYKRNEDFLEHFFCKNNDCNHGMATKIFIETLRNSEPERWASPVTFPIHVSADVKCKNYYCNKNNESCIEIGYGAEQYETEGAYYVNYDDEFTGISCWD